MKRLFLSLLCATLCLTWQGATAQESQYTTLPKFDDTSGAESYTSELLTFEQPISGIRITYHKTTNNWTYNGYPYVYFGEIYITDNNGNDVSYTATTNSLASDDGDGLSALNDKDESTYYHSAYSSNHPIQPDGPVYLELTFSTPQSSFTYKHVRRPNFSNVPIYITYSSLGETVTEAQPISNIETVKDEATSTLYINGKGTIPSYFYNLVDLTDIKNIVIGDGITSIGYRAFYGCSALTSITIPNSVTTIGSSAFYGCSALTSITIPNSVTTIGSRAFSSCYALTSIVIPNSVTTIGDNAFEYCDALTSITIPNSVTTIGGYAFYYCSALTSITIPNSVTTIGGYAFSGCSALTSITIGSGVTTIGSRAFENCKAVTSITVDANNPKYDSRDNCNAIIETETNRMIFSCINTTIPDNIESFSLSDRHFIIPDNITTIKSGMFNGCDNVIIEVPSHVNKIESNAFDGYGITVILSDYISWENGSFYNVDNLICNSIEQILGQYSYAYNSYNNLCIPTGVTYNSSITDRFSNVIYGTQCGDNIYAYEVTDSDVKYLYIAGSGSTYSYDESTAPWKEKEYYFVYLSSGITGIDSYALSYMYSSGSSINGITSKIILPKGLQYIGDAAFYSNDFIKDTLVIGNDVTSIGSNAFGECDIDSVHIGESLQYISTFAFNSNYNDYPRYGISYITVDSNNKYLDSRDNCNAIIETATNTLITGCKNTVIPNSVTAIGNRAFYSYKTLTSITIPNSVTTIGYDAFYNCDALTSITIPNSVTTISSNAFYRCNNLKEVEINTTNIGSWFSGYTSINNVVIGKDVVTIGENAFKDCTGITSITIPNSVATIGSNAFNKASMVYVEGTTPATITTPFKSDVVIYVPDESYTQYCKAEGWKDYLSRLTCEQYDTITVESEAESANSGIMAKIGVDYVGAVRSLKVTGSINSYDVIQFRDKMPLLHTLDLSETTVVASSKPFYEGNCTRDNNLGNYAFTGLTKLQSVKLPKGLTTIGDYMFNECSNLVSVEIPSTVESVGANAFYNCYNLKKVILPKTMTTIGSNAFSDCNALTSIEMPTTLNSLGAGTFYRCQNLKSIVIPNGVKTIKGSNSSYSATTFKECSSLESVTFPDGLEEIEGYAFNNCSKLKEIKLPPTVKNIGTGAFQNNSSLTEIRIPSSVLTIGDNAFSGCNNVKGVYTYTVEPTAISENTFSCFSTATLYVPSFSFYNYYWDEDGWKRFLSLQEFDEPYEYFYVNNDYTLNDDTGYIEGENGNNPDADINSGAGFIVEGEQSDNEDANQQLGDVNVNHDGEGNGGSIIGDNNLHIDNLNIKINVKGGRWYFFAFPFDIPLKNITLQNGSQYIFRYYDGEERAKKGNGGWKDINENHLKAARGYIFQCSANDVLILSIADLRVKKEDKFNELLAHVCDNLKDASWNFTGNPYLGYYDMSETDYTAPITVWDGEKYVAVRPGDDDYHFGPYEAFFVQKPEGKENVGFKGDHQMTGKQSKEKKERQAAARRARVAMGDIDRSRLIVNIELGNEESSDRTRIVFNERQTLNYETSCDAAKFESTGVPQIYTIDDESVHYAINERPAGTGVVKIGYSVAVDGVYTIEAPRMDTTVYLLDKKSNTLHSFLDGGYTFSSEAGKFEARFEILLNDNITGIENVENGCNGNETIYDLGGRKVKRTERGIYIINGEKSLVK